MSKRPTTPSKCALKSRTCFQKQHTKKMRQAHRNKPRNWSRPYPNWLSLSTYTKNTALLTSTFPATISSRLSFADCLIDRDKINPSGEVRRSQNVCASEHTHTHTRFTVLNKTSLLSPFGLRRIERRVLFVSTCNETSASNRVFRHEHNTQPTVTREWARGIVASSYQCISIYTHPHVSSILATNALLK